MSIIINALYRGDRDLAIALIKNALPYQICQYDQLGQTALHIAIQKNYLEVAQLLLDRGANIHALASDPSYTHMTPLHYAAITGNLAAIKLLLSYHPNIYLKNGNFHTAMDLANQHGFLDAMRLIERNKTIRNQNDRHQKYQFLQVNSLEETLYRKLIELENSALRTKALPKPLMRESNVIDFLSYRRKKMKK